MTVRTAPALTRRPKVLGVEPGLLLLAVPAALPILLFSAAPLLYGIYLGFTGATTSTMNSPPFVGLENYAALLQDKYFIESFRVGAVWTFSVVILQFSMAMALALLLNRPIRGRTVFRVLVILPWAMPPVVVAYMWKLVYHPVAGVLNDALIGWGVIQSNINWLGNETWALPAVIIVAVWGGLPATAIVILAALQNVPEELHEAAALDGAGTWARFRTVTWPAIVPIVGAITVLDFISAFNAFGQVYILTSGGPGLSTRLPALYAYQEAYEYGNLGYAAAMGGAMVVLVSLLVVLYLRLLRKGQES